MKNDPLVTTILSNLGVAYNYKEQYDLKESIGLLLEYDAHINVQNQKGETLCIVCLQKQILRLR